MDRGDMTSVVFLDIRKAFDTEVMVLGMESYCSSGLT